MTTLPSSCLRAILAASVIFSLAGIAPPGPARAASPIAAGTWTGYFERDASITNQIENVTVQATGHARSEMTLQVDGAGNVTGTVGPYEGFIQWTVTPAELGGGGSCTFEGSWNVTSGTVTENGAHLPVFDLALALVTYDYQCNPDPGSQPPPATTTLHLEPKTASSGKITGEKFRFDVDQIEKIISGMAQIGAQMSFTEYWELNSSGASVELIFGDVEQYFLAGVPFQNQYTASVDWHGNPPGTVEFDLGGLTQVLPGEAEVSAAFNLEGLPPGKNPLVVTAIGADGQPSGSLTHDVIIVPLEPWAQAAGFYAAEKKMDGIQRVVIYRGKTGVPPEPIVLPYLDLSAIPVIGGQWGVPPFKLNVNLQANSGGGLSDPAPVDGEAKLFLGGGTPELKMTVTGQAMTNLTESALLFDNGKANFNLSPLTLERNVGLVDMIPLAAAIYEVPVVGDMLKAWNGVLGLRLQLTAKGTGQGDLGVAADKTQLVFTQGSITPSVKVSAKPGVNLPGFLTMGVGGGGQALFVIRIAPNPGLQNCQVSLFFWAQIKVLELLNAKYDSPNYTVVECKQALLNGQRVLVVDVPPELAAELQAAELQAAALRAGGLAQVALPQAPAGPALRLAGPGTVLVSGAAPQAELDLALGPQGRMAFVYTTGAAGGVGLRLFDGQSWGEPIALGEAGRRLMTPVAAYDASGRLIVAWVQPPAGDPPAQSELETYARGWEIAYALIDAGGQIVKQDSLTQDDRLDFAPQLARGGGGVWLAWLQSPATSLWGPKDNPNRLQAARWDGSGWGAVETAGAELVGALGYRLAASDGGAAAVVASLDGDGDPGTSDDREIAVLQRSGEGWGSAQRVTNDSELDAFPLAAYTPDGKLVLAWERAGAVVGLEGDLAGAPVPWPVGGEGQLPDLAGGELLAGADGELALVWTGFTEVGQGVWLAQRGPAGDWQPARALAGDLDGVGQLRARRTADGALWLGLAQLEVPLGEQDVPDLPASADLAVVGVPGVLQPVTDGQPAGGGGGAGPLGGSNLTGLLLTGGAGLLALAVLGGGGLLLLRRLRRSGSQR